MRSPGGPGERPPLAPGERPPLAPAVRRLLALAGAVVFLDTAFFSAIAPLLPTYTEELGLTKGAAGVLAAAYPAGTLLAALPAILLAARWGVRRTLLAGLLGLGASSLAFGLAESPGVLDLSRFAQGASGALCWTGSLAWLISAGPVERRGELIGIALAAAVAGALIGPAFGTIAAAAGELAVFGSVAVLALGLAAWTARLRVAAGPQRLPARRELGRLLRNRALRVGAWLTALYGLGFGAASVLGPLRLSDLGATEAVIGGAFIAAAVGEMVAAPLAGRLSDRCGRLAPVLLALPASAVVFALLPVPGAAWLVFALIVALGPSVGALLAPGGALMADAAQLLGIGQVVAVALSNVAWSSGEMVGAAAGGGLGEGVGDWLPYGILAVVCLVTAVALRRRSGGSPAPAAGPGAPSPVPRGR